MDTPTEASTPMTGRGPDLPQADHDRELAEDPRALTILSTEHWSLLSARGLAYNESFTRAGMYLTFISMSFVGLALLTQAIGVSSELLIVAAVVLGFDVLVGLMTSLRMMGAALDDMRATHGMNRIRHGYVRIAPSVAQFLVTGTHDDLRSIATTYSFGGRPVDSGIGYALSTSHAMVVLITALLGGTWAAVLGLALGLGLPPALLAGGGIAVIVFLSLALWLRAQVTGQAQRLESRFPIPTDQDHVGS